MARFDWYATSIADTPRNVLGALEASLGDSCRVRPGRALHGYERGWELFTDTGVAARVLAGGRNGNPHAWASGDDTDIFVETVRSTWPGQHVVSRLDSAEDFQAPGAFEKLEQQALTIADRKRLKVSQAGDYYRLEDGRSLYLGSKKSHVFVRLYEKGKQLRSVASHDAELISADWTRLEMQCRPQKEARTAASSATPEEIWGYSGWTKDLAACCMALDVPRVHMQPWRESDDERAFHFMIKQYGPVLHRYQQLLGDWECVGLTIGQAIDDLSMSRLAKRPRSG